VSGREGQAPPPDHEDKPLADGVPDSVGERLTGIDDPKDPDGLITLDSAKHDHEKPHRSPTEVE
jgi:hypothetical protein